MREVDAVRIFGNQFRGYGDRARSQRAECRDGESQEKARAQGIYSRQGATQVSRADTDNKHGPKGGRQFVRIVPSQLIGNDSGKEARHVRCDVRSCGMLNYFV